MDKLTRIMTETYNDLLDEDNDTSLLEFIEGFEEFLNDIED